MPDNFPDAHLYALCARLDALREKLARAEEENDREKAQLLYRELKSIQYQISMKEATGPTV